MRAKPLKFQIKIIVSEQFQLKLGWFFLSKAFLILIFLKYIKFLNMLVFSRDYNNFYPKMLQGTI